MGFRKCSQIYIVGDPDCYVYAIMKLKWRSSQRLNQHFNKAIRVWDLSAMPFYQSGAGCFFADSGLPSDPPAEGEKLCVYSDFF